MINSVDETIEPEGPPSPKLENAERRWQLGVRSLLLLMAVVAVWMAVFVNKREIHRLDKLNEPMRPLARELEINDERAYAIVQRQPIWPNDLRWDLHVPNGKFRLCLATREIVNEGVAKPAKTVSIDSGSHCISLEVKETEAGTQIRVLSDDKPLLTFEEPKGWESLGWTSAELFPTSKQLQTDSPLVFYRRRFVTDHQSDYSGTSPDPTNGILLWIERVIEK